MANLQRTSKAIWTTNTVQTFCDICASAVEKDTRPGTHLNAQGWKFVVENFNQLTGLKYDKVQLKNKWDQLKGEWKLWKELKGKETGLGWDYTIETVDAPADWWAAKISVNKEFAKFQRKGFPPNLESKCDVMFGQTVTTGVNSYTLVILDDPMDEPDEPMGDNIESPHVASSSRPSKLTVRRQAKDGNAACKFREDISRLAATVESAATGGSNKSDPSRISIDECMKDLNSIDEIPIDGELYYIACELFEQKTKRFIWLNLRGNEAKVRWLKYHHAKLPKH